MTPQPDITWLSDPQVFSVNRLDPYSDHISFPDLETARKGGKSAFRQSLNGHWKFKLAAKVADRPRTFHETGFDASGWNDIQVPGYMQLQGYGPNQYVNTQYPWDGVEELRPPQVPEANPVGSYLRDFTFSGKSGTGRVVLTFDGVETAFYVWLNGVFIGYSEDSFTPAHFDITDQIAEGKNRIAVQVFQRSSASWIEDQDFWRLTGIFRDVRLEKQPFLHLEDLFINTDFNDDFSTAVLRLQLKLRLMEEGASVDVAMTSPSGRMVARASALEAKPGLALNFDIEAPSLWSAEKPDLYDVMIIVRNADGNIVEAVPEKVGFRCFEMKNKVMHLNGKRIIFNGINRHDFDARRGRAVTYEQMLWDIRFFKQNNINAVRTSHYPNQSVWYRLCDVYGIYLIDEANLESHGSWQKDGAVKPEWVVPDDLPEWRNCVLDRAKSMLERDKNHPSILIWSCGNESFGGKTLYEMSEYFRKRDPSRLVHYEGIAWDRRYNDTSDMESRMYAKPQDIEAYLRDNPQKPFILCEYMHAMGNSCGGMHFYTDLIDQYELYQGGFVWDYIDQALAVGMDEGDRRLGYGGDFGDRPSDYEFCADGIVTAWRESTPKVQEVKALYQPADLTPEIGGVTVRNKNMFISTAGYLLCTRLLLDGVEIFSDNMETDIAAGESAFIELELPETREPGEYALQCALCLKEAAQWADAGHEIAFGEHIWTIEGAKPQSSPVPLKLERGDLNLSVETPDSKALFSEVFGGISSIKAGGLEFIRRPPRLTFWRAMTDNDRGRHHGFDLAVWQTAGLYQKRSAFAVDVRSDEPSISYRFALPNLPVEPSVTYKAGRDGLIHVEAYFPGAENLPDLPLFGLQFTMSADFDRFRFYGLGPDENYADRMRSARLGIFESTVSGNLSPYLVPQESGNRMGVRWAEVTDPKGRGLRFSAKGRPFEFGALPYSAMELENALRPEELPPIYRTVVTIAAKQMGVGGDDSWGAPVHEPYRISSSEALSLSFSISPVGIVYT